MPNYRCNCRVAKECNFVSNFMTRGLSSTCHLGGNQVDGLPPVGNNTDAGGIRRLRSERIFGKTATLKSILRVDLSFE